MSYPNPCLNALLLLVSPVLAAQGSTGDKHWTSVLDDLAEDHRELSTNLEDARKILAARASKADARDLLPELDRPVPKPTKHGYGLLPRLLPDRRLEKVELCRNTYSIVKVREMTAHACRDGAALLRSAQRDEDLAAVTREFTRLRDRTKNIEARIAYHRYWQKAVIDHAKFFALRNRVLPLASKLRDLVTEKGDAREIGRLRTLIEAKVAPFHKTPRLRIEGQKDGTRVLRVRVLTDIEDDTFLEACRKAVDTAYNHSDAARAARFRVDLSFVRISASSLYDGEPPRRGARIEEKAHLARFPTGALVLTTGARSTHAFVGRYIQLGSNPTQPRTLAHEFGHLLGFSDAYLRGYEGQPGGALGCTVIEWGGLQDNLMGSPSRGPVTEAMVQRLIAAYK